jgi:disulfide bond formation protein DsbB
MIKKWFYGLISSGLLVSGLLLSACNEGSALHLPQESSQVAKATAITEQSPAPIEETAAPASAASVPAQTSSSDPAAGQALFASCSACHGPAGEGIPGLGKDLTNSEFVAGKTDDELISFIKDGLDPSDPLNITGIAMPPKGGNPALEDEDLYNIVAYIRSLHK